MENERLSHVHFGGIELVDLGDDQQTGEVGECHEAGAGIHAGCAHDDLPFTNGDFEHGAIEGSEDAGLGEAVIDGLAAAEGFIETVFLDSKVSHHIEKFLFTQEPALVELGSAVEVALGFSHGETRALDLSFRSSSLIKEIGVINRHQKVAFFHTLAGSDMDAADFPSDLRLHIDLQRGFDLACEEQFGRDVGTAGLGCGENLDFINRRKGRPALVKSGSSENKNEDG